MKHSFTSTSMMPCQGNGATCLQRLVIPATTTTTQQKPCASSVIRTGVLCTTPCHARGPCTLCTSLSIQSVYQHMLKSNHDVARQSIAQESQALSCTTTSTPSATDNAPMASTFNLHGFCNSNYELNREDTSTEPLALNDPTTRTCMRNTPSMQLLILLTLSFKLLPLSLAFSCLILSKNTSMVIMSMRQVNLYSLQ